MKPDEFAAVLIEKLECVKREQEAQEKLDRKLQEVCGSCFTGGICQHRCNFAVRGGRVADTLGICLAAVLKWDK
jgi:hypothetical protein